MVEFCMTERTYDTPLATTIENEHNVVAAATAILYLAYGLGQWSVRSDCQLDPLHSTTVPCYTIHILTIDIQCTTLPQEREDC